VLAGAGGVYASFWLDAAPAPTIVLILTGLFVTALLARNLRNGRAALSASGAERGSGL
jgi:manganese/iron transport system permease protein